MRERGRRNGQTSGREVQVLVVATMTRPPREGESGPTAEVEIDIRESGRVTRGQVGLLICRLKMGQETSTRPPIPAVATVVRREEGHLAGLIQAARSL